MKILWGHAVASILFKLFFLMVAANLQHEEKLGNSGLKTAGRAAQYTGKPLLQLLPVAA